MKTPIGTSTSAATCSPARPRRHGRRLTAVALAGVIAVAVAGASVACTATRPAAPATPSPAPRQEFDPPTVFGPAQLTLAGRTGLPAPQALDGVYGWSLTDAGLTRVDLTTGEVIVGGFPRAPLFRGLDLSRPTAIGAPEILGAPVLADLPSGRRVLAAWPVEQPGQGTTPSQRGIELISADPKTAQTLTSTTVPLPRSWLEESLTGFTVYVTGVVGTTAVVSAAAADAALTAAVDLPTGRLLWSTPDVAAQLLTDDTVVVRLRDLARSELRGLALADGRPRWAGIAGSSVSPLGTSRALVDLRTLDNAWGGSQVIDTATGRELDSPLNGQPGWTCRRDQQSLTVCSLAPYNDTDAVLGFDDNGTELWRITRDTGRVVPTVTTAWHGMVYGYTDNGPVVLDGRTGADHPTPSPDAPILVNGYFAITAAPAATPEQRPNYRHPSTLVARPTVG